MAEAPVSSGWAKPADAQRPHDPLLECLVALSRLHGQPRSHDALSVGLPLVNNQLTPSLFARAARRAGLASKMTRRAVTKINPALLPAVLPLKDHNACLLVGWEKDGKVARVILTDESVDEFVARGQAKLDQRRWTDALSEFEAALSMRPRDARILQLVADARRRVKEQRDRIGNARRLMADRQFRDAVAILRAVLEEVPDDLEARSLLRAPSYSAQPRYRARSAHRSK